jgi:hypothetical protein
MNVTWLLYYKKTECYIVLYCKKMNGTIPLQEKEAYV